MVKLSIMVLLSFQPSVPIPITILPDVIVLMTCVGTSVLAPVTNAFVTTGDPRLISFHSHSRFYM